MMEIARWMTAVMATLFMTGCMVGPNYRRPEVATPSSYGEMKPATGEGTSASAASSEPVAAAWWTTFNDGGLNSLIERTVRSNLDLRQAEARVREARAARAIEGAALWPQVGASAGYSRNLTSRNVPSSAATQGRWYNLFQTGLDTSWEIDLFGGVRRSIEAADASLESVRDDRNAVIVLLMAEVGSEYVAYRSLQQRITLAEHNLETQQSTLDLTLRLFNAGLAPELDVTRAQAQVATTASALPLLKQSAAQSMHRLGTLIGQPPMTLQAELAPSGPIPATPAQVAVGLPSDLLLRRPDVARSERALAAATAQIGVATRDLFPRFFLTGSAGLQSISSSNLFEWASRFVSIGPSISWPVFQGGRIRANIALQTARQEELLAAYEGTVLQAFQEVEDALVAFSHEQERRTQLAEAVRADQRAAELSNQLYAQGLTDFLSVLVAEQSLFTSQDAAAQSERDVALDLVALYQAVGGGWQVAAGPTE